MIEYDTEMAFNNMEAQIRESFLRVVYTHKAHMKCADDIVKWFRWRRIAQTFLSALATTGFANVLLGNPLKSHDSALWSGGCALALTFLNVYMQGNNAMQEAQKHIEIAGKLWAVRESYMSLINDLVSRTVSFEQAKEQRAMLQTKLEEIYKDPIQTTPASYKAAQKGLKVYEELTSSDNEIDSLLPEALRKSKRLAIGVDSSNTPLTENHQS